MGGTTLGGSVHDVGRAWTLMSQVKHNSHGILSPRAPGVNLVR